MPDRRDPPPTDEGWYALHDFRRIDWDAWREATDRDRERAIEEASEYLESAIALDEADEGASALYTVFGHKADFMVLHLRPSTAEIGALERGFERTEFAAYTERTTSFFSVTEASGYSERARAYFEGELDESSGLARYIRSRLEPTVPEATHVCFYPMSKRRDPVQNWYDLSFDERAEHMEAHGEIGRDYGGRVTQMITGAIALDDWEWGVTLWGDDLVDMKDLLYEMRFDPSTSQFAEFGRFYVGRRMEPADLEPLLAGESVPAEDGATGGGPDADPVHPGEADADHDQGADHDQNADHGDAEPARPDAAAEGVDQAEADDLTGRLATLGLHRDQNYDAGDHAVILYSTAEAQAVASEVEELRGHFENYDSHVQTAVRAQGGRSAVASIWDTARAAETAEGFLLDLPEVVESVRGPIEEGATGETTHHDGADGEDAAGDSEADIRAALADLDIYAGQPHGEDVFALVLYSTADIETLTEEVDSLSAGFDRYDTHEGTDVYEDPDGDASAVVSRWATADAADTASDYLADLPEVVGWADEQEGFGTMGMFYRVKPEHREDFVEKFEAVGDLLADMEGHRESALLVNVVDENDMFIASQWDSKDDAMAFFRSEAFSDTVDWGRDILADKPRHVFLA